MQLTHDCNVAIFADEQTHESMSLALSQFVAILPMLPQPDWHAGGKSLGETPVWRLLRARSALDKGEDAVAVDRYG